MKTKTYNTIINSAGTLTVVAINLTASILIHKFFKVDVNTCLLCLLTYVVVIKR